MYCVWRDLVWQELTDAAYCALRICIRALEGLGKRGYVHVLRIAYAYYVSEVWEGLRIAYCVSVLRVGGMGAIA